MAAATRPMKPCNDALKMKGVQQAMISAGYNNSYGHPHQEVLQLLQQRQIGWQRTDWQRGHFITGR